jgi:hypothetical protein
MYVGLSRQDPDGSLPLNMLRTADNFGECHGRLDTEMLKSQTKNRVKSLRGSTLILGREKS